MTEGSIEVPLTEATDRQLLLEIVRRTTSVEASMGELTDRVAALEGVVAPLRDAISAIGDRFGAVAEQLDALRTANDGLQAALDAERQAAADLASSEAAEDVAQDQALSDAKAATDAALAEQADAILRLGTVQGEVQAAVDQANSLQPAPEPTP